MQTALRDRRLADLDAVVQVAFERVASALSEMAGVPIAVSCSSLDVVRLAEVFTAAGDPQAVAIGVYVGITGEGAGTLLLLLDESTARQLSGLMLGSDPSAVCLDDDLSISALAEAGNVGCSTFMNTLADATRLRLEATPPVVVNDMLGAIVDSTIADIAMLTDEAVVIGTQLVAAASESGGRGSTDARLLVIPAPGTLHDLLDRLSHRPSGEA
jgi:chemotaxis protein CheC